MKWTGRRRGIAAAVAVLLVVAGLGWQYGWRTRREQVGPRFVEALIARHPGTTIGEWNFGRLHATLPTGVEVEARLIPLFEGCESDRPGCGTAIERSLDDVDRILAASRAPSRAMLEAVIVDEPTPGFRFGYVTEPLIGSLEVRYALVSGVASTFVTASIASRLGLAASALREVALARLRADPSVSLLPVAGSDDSVYRVESSGDAPASLLDRERMKRLTTQMNAERLYVALAGRGALYVAKADEAGATAISDLLARPWMAVRRKHLFAYDPAAADGSTLSFARSRR